MHFRVKLMNAALKLEKSGPGNSSDNDQVRWYIPRVAYDLEPGPFDEITWRGCQGAMNSITPRLSSCLPAAVCFSVKDRCKYADFPLHIGKYEIFMGIIAGALCLSLGLRFIGKGPVDLENRCGPPSNNRGINPCQWLICSLKLPAMNWKSFYSRGMWVWLRWQSIPPPRAWAHRQNTWNSTLVSLESTPRMSVHRCELGISPKGQLWLWVPHLCQLTFVIVLAIPCLYPVHMGRSPHCV